MKKGGVLTIGIIVILFALVMLVKHILPTFTSNKLSTITGTPVSIASIDLSSSTIKAHKIHINNPKEYDKTPQALSIGTFTLHAPLFHFIKNNTVIDEISLNKVYMGLQFDSNKRSKGNWTIIMNNVNKNIFSKQKKTKDKGGAIHIKRLIINDLQIELAYTEENKANYMLKPIEQIEFTNISSDNGISLAQITNIVMREALCNVLSKEGLQNILEDIINKDKKKSVIDIIKDFFQT